MISINININSIICLLFFGFFVVSCASRSPMNDPKGLKEKGALLESAKVDSEPFIKGYRGLVFTSKAGRCQLPSVNKTDWQIWVKVGADCVAAKNWIFVDRVGQELSLKEPHAPWGAYFLSIAAENRSNLLQAQWYVDLAIKKAPNLGLLDYQKSRIYFLEKEFELAATTAESAIKKDPELTPAHLFLAQLYHRDGDLKNAESRYEDVLKLESKNKEALMGLAECLAERKELARALEYFSRGSVHYPREFHFQWRKAELLESEKKDFEQALNTYRSIYDLYRRRTLEGDRPRDVKEQLDQKIKALEAQVRSVASVKKESKEEKK